MTQIFKDNLTNVLLGIIITIGGWFATKMLANQDKMADDIVAIKITLENNKSSIDVNRENIKQLENRMYKVEDKISQFNSGIQSPFKHENIFNLNKPKNAKDA